MDSDSTSSSGSSSNFGEDIIFNSTDEDESEREDRICIENYEDTINRYRDKDFIMHFRVSRNVAEYLISRFSVSPHYVNIIHAEGRLNISAAKHILAFLWFVGHDGTSYRVLRDRFDVSLSTMFDIITRVSDFLVDISLQHVKWPTEKEMMRTKNHFNQQKGFPGVIGCIDGTHIRIDRPKESSESYYNRKEFFSIQMQVVCNEECKILDAFIGYPGSVHDARVFENSPLVRKLTGELDGYLLEDSAYPCLPTLMTPFKDNGHLTAAQTSYNKKLSSCRIRVEHTIGILKQRFRILYHMRLRNHARKLKVIYVCCVLHSLCNHDDVKYLEAMEIEELVQAPENCDFFEAIQELQSGLHQRSELCTYLANR